VARSRRPSDEGRLIQLVYHAYVAGSALARAVPEPVAYGLARSLGSFIARISKKRRVVAKNLARITGQDEHSQHVQELVVEAYRSYARYWLETFRLVREDKTFFLDRFRATGESKLAEMVERYGGCVIVVTHLGNWDAAGAWVGSLGFRLVSVAEVLKPRRMFEFFLDHRARLGMVIYPAEKGVTEKLVAEVKNGSVVAILGDRDLKGTGPEVTFFGEKTTMPGGSASLALRTGVPLLVAGLYGTRFADGKRGWDAEIRGPLEMPEGTGPEAIAELTRRLASELEELIARRPEEWHVFQPFWPADGRRGGSDAPAPALAEVSSSEEGTGP
jgi:phosphatidylinositol dimannoside acyltransferase